MDAPTTARIHYILYPLLGAALLGALWLWHSTEIKGLEQQLQDLKTAHAAQVATDKSATSSIDDAIKQQKTKTTLLSQQLNSATTAPQQAALINSYLGTHVDIQPQAENPSQYIAEVPVEELPLVTRDVVQYQEMANQVDTDKVVIAAKDTQIAARDTTIKDQTAAITKLKGGSHLRQFIRAAKYVGIGIAVGVVVDRVNHP